MNGDMASILPFMWPARLPARLPARFPVRLPLIGDAPMREGVNVAADGEPVIGHRKGDAGNVTSAIAASACAVAKIRKLDEIIRGGARTTLLCGTSVTSDREASL